MDGAPTPPTPYRDGKALAEIIPPDRRREKAIALVGSSMVAGVALWVLGGWAVDALRATDAQPIDVIQTPGYVAGRVPQSMLSGPGGVFAMPPRTRSVVHIWLQGCADCMPAFEAMAKIHREGGLNVDGPVVNVAYGEADQTWAGRYGVATNLVFDPGGAKLVKPLGIGTFTTLVVDPDGTIIHRDRPDRPGYVTRVRAAMNHGGPLAMPADPAGDPVGVVGTPLEEAIPFDSAAVESVIAEHRSGIKRTCWEGRGRTDAPSHVSVTITLTVGTEGRVLNSASTGDDPVIAKCIEQQTRSWLFPRPATPTSVNIPFKFVQE